MHPPVPVGRFTRLRIAFILLGIFLLLWLPIEEHSLVLLLLISVCTCVLGLLRFLDWRRQRQAQVAGKQNSLWYPLAGTLAGAAVTLVAMGLMAVKTGIHGHGAPDYSPAQVSLVLYLAPLWIFLGLIAGGLVAAWRR